MQAKPQVGMAASSASPASVQQHLGEGESMAPEVVTRFSQAYGHDLSDVRLHRDSHAASTLGARAVTVGRDVAFAPGEYRPGTPAGDKLIGHELAHVVQQSGGAGLVQGAGLGEDRYEREADRAADAAVKGGTVARLSPVAGSVQRSPADGTSGASAEGGGGAGGAPAVIDVARAAAEQRALIDKALTSRAPGDVQWISDYARATQAERIALIEIALGDGASYSFTISAIWQSFGEEVGAVAGQHLELWDQCREQGIELEELPALKTYRGKLKQDVMSVAFSNLDTNERLVQAEFLRYGLSPDKQVNFTDSFQKQAAQYFPLPQQEIAELEKTKKLARQVLALQQLQERIRRTPVGLGGEPFNPARPPLLDFKLFDEAVASVPGPLASSAAPTKSAPSGTVPMTSHRYVKQQWDETQKLLNAILNQNPVLIAAANRGGPFSLDLATADPEKNPRGCRTRCACCSRARSTTSARRAGS
ncbi:Hypothetical protein A7982_04943 [Minicystis rosea]|nr:Hypothetical protein A7982_04943 [Minicystis rosea]